MLYFLAVIRHSPSSHQAGMGGTTGATAMWQGADDGVLHGIVMWSPHWRPSSFSAVGSGIALGSFYTTDVYDEFSLEDVSVEQARSFALSRSVR